MMILRPYTQTNLWNLFIGFFAPLGFSYAFYRLFEGPAFSGRLTIMLSFPFFIAGGLYYLFARCVWKLRCDDEKGILYFTKTFKRVIFRARELRELNVFRTSRGYDYRFKTSTKAVTVEEMDGMAELVTYLKKVNPQINISSPDDHVVFGRFFG
jgi:hypothetical protein